MITRYSFLPRLILLLGDLIVLNLSYEFGYLAVSHWLQPNLSGHFILSKILIFNLGWLTIASNLKLYGRSTSTRLEQIFRQTVKATLAHALFFLAFLICSGEKTFAVKFLPVCYGSLMLLFIFSRFLLTYMAEALMRRAKLQTKIAIIGQNQTGHRLARYFLSEGRYSFQGFFDEKSDGLAVDAEGRIVGSGKIEEYIQVAADNDIREVYSTIFPLEHAHLNRLIEIADRQCVRFKLVPDFNNALESGYHMEFLNSIPVISLRREPLQDDMENSLKKRTFDLLFSSLVVVFILWWLVPILGLLIKLESKGPVFFRQLRSGRDNRPFWCYKFRSMRSNGVSDSQQASKGDMRVTRIGKFIRKTSLDELPQFFNVLKGDMSVVGPRPHMLKHTEQYSALIGKYMVRQFLRPGITGWAQVNGYRGETRDPELMAKRVEYDIWYMENWSYMLDIKVIFMTIINLLKGEVNAF